MADQIVAVLRQAEGFPLSTGDVARALGDRLVVLPDPPPDDERPACWPRDLDAAGRRYAAHCDHCDVTHTQPVWRRYSADDARPLLNRLANDGAVDKVVLNGTRNHYWRSTPTHRP